MKKSDKKHHKLLMLLCLFCNMAFTQAKTGIENYNLLSSGSGYVWMPVFHYQAKSGIYTELRYNYEDLQTISIYGGKTYTGGKALQFTLTPMVGFSTGKFRGFSLATNADIDWHRFYFSSQTQMSVATKQSSFNFFFNWSELGFNISNSFFGGVAVQYTRQAEFQITEPGFVAGFTFNNISVPVYILSPFSSGLNFVVGLNFEFNFKAK